MFANINKSKPADPDLWNKIIQHHLDETSEFKPVNFGLAIEANFNDEYYNHLKLDKEASKNDFITMKSSIGIYYYYANILTPGDLVSVPKDIAAYTLQYGRIVTNITLADLIYIRSVTSIHLPENEYVKKYVSKEIIDYVDKVKRDTISEREYLDNQYKYSHKYASIPFEDLDNDEKEIYLFSGWALSSYKKRERLLIRLDPVFLSDSKLIHSIPTINSLRIIKKTEK